MYIMKRKDLLALEACTAGLEMFDKFAKGQGDSEQLIYPDGWTPVHTVFIYHLNARIAYWLEYNNIAPTNELDTIEDPESRAMVKRLREILKKSKVL